MTYPSIAHHSAAVQDSIKIWRTCREMEDLIGQTLFLAVPEATIEAMEEFLAYLKQKQRIADDIAFPDTDED